MVEVSRKSYLWRHILGIASIVTYEQAFNYVMSKRFEPIIALIFYSISISLFYLTAYGIYPFAFNTKRNWYFKLGLALLFSIPIFLLLQYWASIFAIWYKPSKTEYEFDTLFYLQNSGRYVYISILAAALYLSMRAVKKEQKLRVLEVNSMKIELENKDLKLKLVEREREFYKMQNDIFRAKKSPHLLLNSLTFFQTTIESASVEDAEMFTCISDLLKYTLDSSDHQGKVPLADELAQVENYVKMAKIKYGPQCFLDYNADKLESTTPTILPVTLLNLAENLVTHGILSDPANPARINISYNGNRLVMETSNLVKVDRQQPGYGLGLEGTKSRLKEEYGGRFNINCKIEENTFYLKLEIEL